MIDFGNHYCVAQIWVLSLGTCCPPREQRLFVSCSPIPHHVIPEGPLEEHGRNFWRWLPKFLGFFYWIKLLSFFFSLFFWDLCMYMLLHPKSVESCRHHCQQDSTLSLLFLICRLQIELYWALQNSLVISYSAFVCCSVSVASCWVVSSVVACGWIGVPTSV